MSMQGTGNVLNIGMQEYGIWMQSIIDDISNDDQTGVMSPDQPAKRRFGGWLASVERGIVRLS